MTQRHRLLASTLLASAAAPAFAADAPAPTLLGFVLALLVLCAPVGATWLVWRRSRAAGRSQARAAGRGVAAGASAFLVFLLLFGAAAPSRPPQAEPSRIARSGAAPGLAAGPLSPRAATAVPVAPTPVAAVAAQVQPTAAPEDRAWYTVGEIPQVVGDKLMPRAVCNRHAGGPAAAIESMTRMGVAHRLDEKQSGNDVVEVTITTPEGRVHFVRSEARCLALIGARNQQIAQAAGTLQSSLERYK